MDCNNLRLLLLDEEALTKAGAVLHRSREACTLASDLVLVTGEVERVTDFERGFPWAKANYVVPMHCTGWKAINQFAKAMPGQFLLNSVGTTYVFQ